MIMDSTRFNSEPTQCELEVVRAHHVGVLSSAGIVGTDAASVLNTLEARSPEGVIGDYVHRLAWGLDGLNAEQRNRVLMALFGSDAVRGASVLIDAVSA